ncbi:MAG TPA: hypothetical protein VF615_28185 [Longimicrobiaceae bacterium]|jgi:hypothetical protein
MRTPPALLRTAAGAALAAALAGCAARSPFPDRPAPESLPEGSPLRSATLAEGDAWLRHHLMAGDAGAALRLLDAGARTAPRDELVRRLQLGVVLHQAGRHAESNDALEWAEREAENRFTRSAARAAGSVLVNDGMLEYLPSRAERAMIPYYRMLNYLALGDRGEATVEARKAGALLDGRGPGEGCAGEAFLPWLAGMVFQAAGERNDALVSLRRAQRAADGCAGEGLAEPPGLGADLIRAATELGVREVADSARKRYGLGPAAAGRGAELVVVVEHGWVAHRAGEDVHVPVFPEDLEGDGDGEAVARVSARLFQNLAEQASYGSAFDDHPAVRWAATLGGAHVLKFAWPVHRLEASRPAEVRVLVDDSASATAAVEDVSSGVVRDFEGRRPWVLTRAVGRGVVKFLAAREVEKKAEKEGGDVAGYVAGRIANLAGNALEQADTRSWSLLPDRISLARLSLAPGEHRVRIEVQGGAGEAPDTLELGTVTVRPGERVFLSRRVWGAEGGDPEPLRRWYRRGFAGGYDPRWAADLELPATRSPEAAGAMHVAGDAAQPAGRARPEPQVSAGAAAEAPAHAAAVQAATPARSRPEPQPRDR